MREIVPLFHPTWGRVGVGPQNWDTFQRGFAIVLRRGKFEGIDWDPWWRPRRIGEKRKAERRTKERRTGSGQVRVRACGPEEIFQVLRSRETRSHPRPRTERRESENHTELRRLADLLEEGRKRGSLTDTACMVLAEFFRRLCLCEAYEQWKTKFSPPSIFEQSGWSEREHREKFRDYAAACCLEDLRPGSLGWRTQNSGHMESVYKFAELFPLAPAGPRRKAIRAFIERHSDLGQIIKLLQPQKPLYPVKALFLIWINRQVKPKPFFENLRVLLLQHGIKLSPKPGSYRKQIERLKRVAMEFEDRFEKLQA